MTYQRQDSARTPGGQGGGQDRQYVGKGRWIDFKNGGGKFRLSLTPDGVELICRNQNSSGWANLCMSEMRTPDKHGNQYTVYIDDYVPNQQTGTRTVAPRPGGDRRRYNDGGFGNDPDTAPPQEHKYGPEDDPYVQEDIEDDIPF